MNVRFKIIRLTLIGESKNYEVVFRDGFNYISGHTSTGKTSILEMIDYALGSKGHKSYIEIGNKCTSVELEIVIEDETFKITRKLFDFKSAVIVQVWNDDKEKYFIYDRFEIDTPKNPKSLAAFLLEKLGLVNYTIKGQSFSFRDIYKYCYIKQTEIDNENILEEKIWQKDIKRKATFEILFNIYDTELEDHKKELEDRKNELNELITRFKGIEDFLDSAELDSIEESQKESIRIKKDIDNLSNELSVIKQSSVIDTNPTNKLRETIARKKEDIKKNNENKIDQLQYVKKLKLLYNQYNSEIQKKEMAIEGYFVFNEFEFKLCPNCLKPLSNTNDKEACCLCGNENSNEKSELIILKKEIALIKRKANELLKFIEKEDVKYDQFLKEEIVLTNSLNLLEAELQHLYKDYVNPNIEQIEFLNYEIGRKNSLLYEVDKNLKMFVELERLQRIINDKEAAIESLKSQIKELSKNIVDKQTLIIKLSKDFTSILEAFEYPKLSDSYISDKNYLPYVRGHKYDDIGSLAGVTLITIAYYLTVLINATEETFNHPGLLIIDSPRKNLGAQSSDDENEEFKDEKIFNSTINYLYDLGEKHAGDFQLIVVNNGYPPFIKKECIIAEFDSDGHGGLPVGLIDDV